MISDFWTKIKTLISHNYPRRFQSSTSNIHQFLNRHQGEVIAVLGSGPSLTRYRGGLTSIAVNGAALYDVPYSYFMCGDIMSPRREWFYASERFKATRIVASFVSVEDEILFPSETIRSDLRRQIRLNKKALQLTGSIDFLYPFAPKHAPKSGHAWFQYDRRFENFDLPSIIKEEKFGAGATISQQFSVNNFEPSFRGF